MSNDPPDRPIGSNGGSSGGNFFEDVFGCLMTFGCGLAVAAGALYVAGGVLYGKSGNRGGNCSLRPSNYTESSVERSLKPTYIDKPIVEGSADEIDNVYRKVRK